MDNSINFSEYLLNNLNNVQFQKRFGQNFLLSDEYPRKLVESAKLSKNDVVIEVGTGLGSVTDILSRAVNTVISFEIDSVIYEKAKRHFDSNDNITLANTDILSISDIYKYIVHSNHLNNVNNDMIDISKDSYKVVSSLPYNISKKVIKHFLEQNDRPITMTYIIQNEVALNYAPKNNKQTFLSNYANLYGEVKYICKVPKQEFYPIPKVDGAIIHFEIDENKASKVEQGLVKFIKGGFSAPRRTISNVLANMLHRDKREIIDILMQQHINPQYRAEDLGIEDWKNLYSKLLIKLTY